MSLVLEHQVIYRHTSSSQAFDDVCGFAFDDAGVIATLNHEH
jgi:hypothetical protein